MQASLTARVLDSISRHRMLRAGGTLGVAVSGGADSVALLRVLLELRDRLGIRLTVLHFNHQLRGADALADQKFVEELAASHRVPCDVGTQDVREAARREGWNLEDAGRKLRYRFFEERVARGDMARVAVAHTSDDQAETVLAHLLRGTGLTGLAGIHPVRGAFVRPLLEIRRHELRKYLRARGQPWREDASNEDTTRLRARIRHRLLPLLAQDFQPEIVAQLCRMASLATEQEAFWDAWATAAFRAKTQRESPDAITIRAADLIEPIGIAPTNDVLGGMLSDEAGARSASCALSRRLVRRICQELRGDLLGLTAGHTDQVLRLAGYDSARDAHRRKGSWSGRETHLPGVRVERDFETIRFVRVAEASAASARQRSVTATADAAHFEYTIDLEGSKFVEVAVPEIGRRVRLKSIDWPHSARETTLGQAVIDRDRLRSPLIVRSWLPGDCFRPSGRRNIRKLKRLLLESRVSLRDRAGWPVVTSAGAIVWARGFPVAADFAAVEGTAAGVLIEEELL